MSIFSAGRFITYPDLKWIPSMGLRWSKAVLVVTWHRLPPWHLYSEHKPNYWETAAGSGEKREEMVLVVFNNVQCRPGPGWPRLGPWDCKLVLLFSGLLGLAAVSFPAVHSGSICTGTLILWGIVLNRRGSSTLSSPGGDVTTSKIMHATIQTDELNSQTF